MAGPGNLIDQYLAYACNNESPAIYHRWACITALGAALGNRVQFAHGHLHLSPNFYTILIGTPGVRKSTAIKMVGKILRRAGYHSISSGKTTKEKFILDLAEGVTAAGAAGRDEWGVMEQNLFGDLVTDIPACNLILADEMNDFFGNNILDFASFLGTLWDWEGPYENKIKNGPSVVIQSPTISFLAGTTPGTFASTFPPEIIGQGFFSRTLLIHGEPNGKRIAFPKPPTESDTALIVGAFKAIIDRPACTISLSHRAESLLEAIYNTNSVLTDGRFATYRTRRFTHLLKLCIILACAANAQSIDEPSIIYANTILHYAEQFMPKALGEFGRARSSGATDRLLSVIDSAPKIWSYQDLWQSLSSEFESMQDMARAISNLIQAGKLQFVSSKELGTGGVLLNKKVKQHEEDPMTEFVDYSLLTQEERNCYDVPR